MAESYGEGNRQSICARLEILRSHLHIKRKAYLLEHVHCYPRLLLSWTVQDGGHWHGIVTLDLLNYTEVPSLSCTTNSPEWLIIVATTTIPPCGSSLQVVLYDAGRYVAPPCLKRERRCITTTTTSRSSPPPLLPCVCIHGPSPLSLPPSRLRAVQSGHATEAWACCAQLNTHGEHVISTNHGSPRRGRVLTYHFIRYVCVLRAHFFPLFTPLCSPSHSGSYAVCCVRVHGYYPTRSPFPVLGLPCSRSGAPLA